MYYKYELYLLNGTKIDSFESNWIFKEGEKIFAYFENRKRNLRIIKITHDIFLLKETKNNHIVRLYVEEGRVFDI